MLCYSGVYGLVSLFISFHFLIMRFSSVAFFNLSNILVYSYTFYGVVYYILYAFKHNQNTESTYKIINGFALFLVFFFLSFLFNSLIQRF